MGGGGGGGGGGRREDWARGQLGDYGIEVSVGGWGGGAAISESRVGIRGRVRSLAPCIIPSHDVTRPPSCLHSVRNDHCVSLYPFMEVGGGLTPSQLIFGGWGIGEQTSC